jgi:hypothetical protein
MNAIYDVLCSLVISGIVLLMIVTFNGTIAEHAGAQTIRVVTQTNLTTAFDMMEFELRKMGYLVSLGTDSAITYADSDKITFKCDVDHDGSLDVITYSLDTASGMNANKNTHILRRTFNGTTQLINVGITKLKITYYDSSGSPIVTYPVSVPRKIKSFKLSVNGESTVSYIGTDEKYLKLNPGVYWERTIKPQNIN